MAAQYHSSGRLAQIIITVLISVIESAKFIVLINEMILHKGAHVQHSRLEIYMKKNLPGMDV